MDEYMHGLMVDGRLAVTIGYKIMGNWWELVGTGFNRIRAGDRAHR